MKKAIFLNNQIFRKIVPIRFAGEGMKKNLRLW